MTVSFRCPNPDCGKTYSLKPNLIGKKVQCSKCSGTFLITQEDADKLVEIAKKNDQSSLSSSRQSPQKTDPKQEPPKPKPQRKRRRAQDIPHYENIEVVEENVTLDDPMNDFASWGLPYGAKQNETSLSTWKKVSVGFLIVAIGNCVMCGAIAAEFLTQGLRELSHVMQQSAKDGQEALADEYQEKLSEVSQALLLKRSVPPDWDEFLENRVKKLKSYRDRRKTAINMSLGSINIHKVSIWLTFMASSSILVGYGFFFLLPNRKNARTLAIIVFALAAINFIVHFVLALLPSLNDGLISDRTYLIVSASRLPVSDRILALTVSLSVSVELVILAFCFSAVVKVKKSERCRIYAEKFVIFSIVYTSLFFILGLLQFVNWQSNFFLYFIWFLFWVANLFLVLSMFFLLQFLFRIRSTLSSAR